MAPGLVHEIEGELPAHLAPHFESHWDFWSFHSPQWWRRHWELSGLLEGIESAWLPDGRENWIRWVEAVQSVSGEGEAAVLDLLEGETGAQMGFVSVTARTR